LNPSVCFNISINEVYFENSSSQTTNFTKRMSLGKSE
jgi:hypothetical protein